MHLGPYEDGSFRRVKVASLHRSGRAPCSTVRQNQTAAIAIKPNYPVRKGMVLLASFGANNHSSQTRERTIQSLKFGLSCGMTLTDEPVTKFRACMELEAEILILFHPTRIHQGFQCTLHIDNIVQSAIIKTIALPAETEQLAKRNKTQSLVSEETVFDCDDGHHDMQSCSLPTPTQIVKGQVSGRTRVSGFFRPACSGIIQVHRIYRLFYAY